MREILFRGKETDNGEWVYGDFVTVYDTPRKKGIETPRRIYEIVPETVGQYTGLTDRNGVKIFEGDIIKYCPYFYKDEEEIGYIKWCKNNATYFVELMDGAVDDFYLGIAKKCEIIGNIHDNPELLRGD